MKELYVLNIRKMVKEYFNQDMSFIFACIYLLFEYVRPHSIYPQIAFLPWPLIVICMTAFFVFIEGSKRKKPKHPINKLMVAYLVVVLVSCMFSYDSSASWRDIRTFLDWFLIYFLLVYAVDSEKKFFIFYVAFLLFSFKMSQHAFISWAKKGFAFSSWGVMGPPGWFANSGELGIQLCIFAPMALYFVFAIRPYVSKFKLYILWLFPFTAFVGAIGTSSRGAVVALVCVLFYIQLISGRFFKSLLAMGLSIVVILAFLPEEQMARFKSSGEDNTSSHRLEKWHQGIETLGKHPILGVGHSAWISYFNDVYATEEYEFGSSPLVHNIFVQCATELGMSGLLMLLLMIYYCFWSNKKTREFASKTDNQFLILTSRGLDAALIGYMASAFFITVLYYPYLWIHLALVVTLNNAAKNQDASQDDCPSTSKS